MNTHEPGPLAPSPPPATPNRPGSTFLSVARVLVLIAGLGIAGLGLSCSAAGLLGVVLSQASGQAGSATAVQAATVFAGLVALSSGLGLALAWHSWRAIQGRASARFDPPRAWPLILLFLLALVVGQSVLSLDLLPVLTFPLAHVAVAAIPPLAILTLAGRALRGAASWRSVSLQLASGTFLATFLAFTLELALLLALLVGVVAVVSIQPGGEQVLGDLAESLARLQVQDPNEMLGLLRLPLVAVGTLSVVALLVPLIEELIKTVGIGLMAYRRPGPAQAVLWGVAAGAGFALMEGLFNTLNSLDDWGFVAVLRVGATLLHCFTGALVGLAWYHALGGRWVRTLGLYIGAVAVHAAWNGLTVGMALVSIEAGGGGSVTPETVAAGAGSVALLVLLVALAGGMALGLAWLVRHARELAHRDTHGCPY